jgi:hypothetical protein
MSRGTLTDGRVRRKKNSCSKFLPTARNRERRSLLSENNQKEKGKREQNKTKPLNPTLRSQSVSQ